MKFVAKLFAITALIGLSHHASADPVPEDMQRYFEGKGTSRTTAPQSDKEKSPYAIWLPNESDAFLRFFDQDGNLNSEATGESLYLPEYSSLLLRFDINPEVYYTGSLRVKGTPGKRKLIGTIYLFQAGFGGLSFIKVKLKETQL